MVRNIILGLSTLGIMSVVFAGYWSLTYVGADNAQTDEALQTLAIDATSTDENVLTIASTEGSASIPPGKDVVWTTYDQNTGRATSVFRAKTWRKLAGDDNQVLIEQPSLTMMMPGGMSATITAQSARVSVDRIERQRNMRPRSGSFEGDARIVIDQSPDDANADDRITILMDDFTFDLELGLLKTDGHIRVRAPEFELDGDGLELVWNQIDNRVERLVLARGGQLVLNVAGDLLGVAPSTQPAAAKPDRTNRKDRPRRKTAYNCTLVGGVNVTHLIDGQQRGALTAETLTLIFDAGGGSRALLAQPKAPQATTSAPSTAPTLKPDPLERLVVRWGGPLTLGPAPSAPADDPPRRQIVADGQTVRVEMGNRLLVCGKLTYHEQSKRLWLHPSPSGRVELFDDGRPIVAADSIFLDQDRGVVKLIGDVDLTEPGNDAMRIHCDLWAELHLTRSAKKKDGVLPMDGVTGGADLESARFVGNVRVDSRELTLRADEFRTQFRPAIADEPLESRLDSAFARGDVLLVSDTRQSPWRWVDGLKNRSSRLLRPIVGGATTSRGQARTLQSGWLAIEFGNHQDGRPFPQAVRAGGGVMLVDAKRSIAARGRKLSATFTDDDQIDSVTVTGGPNARAAIFARPYLLYGETIELNEPLQTLHVDGRSRLSFPARRTLQGRTRAKALPVVITSETEMHIDGRGEQSAIRFVGNVDARTGDERLLADTLTMWLEDAPESTDEPKKPPKFWGVLAGAFRGPNAGVEQAPARVRKEPVRVVARNARVLRERYIAGDPQPITHQSISAPELEIDIRERRIRTVGMTVLGMINRAMDTGGQKPEQNAGIASALMSRGPSQTAMRCDRSMTYIIGEPEPDRRDTVFFDGGVIFRHVTGREMKNIEQMLPDIVKQPELLTLLKTRNTYLECERLEAVFVMQSDSGGAPGTQLGWLNAVGDAFLRDQRGDAVRSIEAHQLEFDREGGLIRVAGQLDPQLDARIYDENLANGQFNTVVGSAFTIDMNNNTIRTGPVRGTLRR